jgi:hypothetical protein
LERRRLEETAESGEREAHDIIITPFDPFNESTTPPLNGVTACFSLRFPRSDVGRDRSLR